MIGIIAQQSRENTRVSWVCNYVCTNRGHGYPFGDHSVRTGMMIISDLALDCIATRIMLLSCRLVTLFRVIKWIPGDLFSCRQSLLIPFLQKLQPLSGKYNVRYPSDALCSTHLLKSRRMVSQQNVFIDDDDLRQGYDSCFATLCSFCNIIEKKQHRTRITIKQKTRIAWQC